MKHFYCTNQFTKFDYNTLTQQMVINQNQGLVVTFLSLLSALKYIDFDSHMLSIFVDKMDRFGFG